MLPWLKIHYYTWSFGHIVYSLFTLSFFAARYKIGVRFQGDIDETYGGFPANPA